jgi:hypothetical protein
MNSLTSQSAEWQLTIRHNTADVTFSADTEEALRADIVAWLRHERPATFFAGSDSRYLYSDGWLEMVTGDSERPDVLPKGWYWQSADAHPRYLGGRKAAATHLVHTLLPLPA